MNVLLICAGGLSTGTLVRHLKEYAGQEGKDIAFRACGLPEYPEIPEDEYDVVLIGPQLAYKLGEVQASVSRPCAAISPQDYALQNVAEIVKNAEELKNLS